MKIEPQIEFTYHEHLIKIDKHFFYLDKDLKITYNSSESNEEKPFIVTWATEKEVEMAHRSGMKIFVYENEESEDGLWHHILGTDTNHDNIFNLIGLGEKTYKEYNYRVILTRREIHL